MVDFAVTIQISSRSQRHEGRHSFSHRLVALLVLMKLVRWPTRRLTGWKASWPALKRNPGDTAILYVCGLAWTVALVAYLVAARQLWAFHMELPVWLRWGGVALGLAATVLLGWADHSLGENLSVTLQIKREHTLVTTGPYRWIRHPIYAAGLMFSVAGFLISANWLVGICFVGGICLLVATRVPREEKMMLDAFGDRYRQYMLHTGRFLPRAWSGPK